MKYVNTVLKSNDEESILSRKGGSMDILEKLQALEPERKRQIINILLGHAKKLQMDPETKILTQWLEEDPERGPVNEPPSEPVPNSLHA